ETRVFAEFLDVTENVIPAAAIQSDDMFAQLEKNFVHLERGGQGFDKHGRLDGAKRHANRFLGPDENIVPQPGFEMAFHFGQIEIGPGAERLLPRVVMKEIKAEIRKRPGKRTAIDFDMRFFEMPAAGTRDQGRRFSND